MRGRKNRAAASIVKTTPTSATSGGTPFSRADTAATATKAISATVTGCRRAATSRPSIIARPARTSDDDEEHRLGQIVSRRLEVPREQVGHDVPVDDRAEHDEHDRRPRPPDRSDSRQNDQADSEHDEDGRRCACGKGGADQQEERCGADPERRGEITGAQGRERQAVEHQRDLVAGTGSSNWIGNAGKGTSTPTRGDDLRDHPPPRRRSVRRPPLPGTSPRARPRRTAVPSRLGSHRAWE